MIGMDKRIIVCRAVGDRAQVSDLRQVELVGRLVKVPFRSGGNPVIAVHEIYIVEIKLKYLVLVILLFKIPCDKDLLDLSLPGPSVVEEYSSRKLHRDRASALRDLPAHDQLFSGTKDRFVIDAIVLVKTLVFNADDRLLEKIGDL